MRPALAMALALVPSLALAAPARHVTLVYTADLGGYLEPCGCSTDQRGGLPRAAAVLSRLRAENPDTFFLGGGDLLFENPPDAETREQDRLKARAVAEALRRMGLAATAAGERDLFEGRAFARSTRLPIVSSLRLGPIGFGELGRVPRAPIRVAVVHGGGTRGALPLAEEAKRQGVDLVLASHRDSLISDDFNRALLDAPVPVVQVQGRGQSLVRVDFLLQGDLSKGFQVLEAAAQRDQEIDLVELRRLEYGRRRQAAEAAGQAELSAALASKLAELAERARQLREAPLPEPPPDRPSLTVSFIPLTADLPEDPTVRRVLTRFYGEVARRNLAAARALGRPCPDPARGEASYIGMEDAPRGGTQGCLTCHPGAYAQWKGTGHGRAYATLRRAERQFDLDCVRCHVTGWQKPGGACSVAATQGREDVQCESCHGPASLHAVDPPGHIERDPPDSRCLACHTPEHSSHFEYSAYRARILGAGHGRPPTGGRK